MISNMRFSMNLRAFPYEIERVGKSGGYLVVGKGERGDDESGVRAREDGAKERLLLAEELPTLPLNFLPSSPEQDAVINRLFLRSPVR